MYRWYVSDKVSATFNFLPCRRCMTSRNDSSNWRAILETPGEVDHEDTMVPLRMVSAKSEPFQAYVFRCIACYLLNYRKDTIWPHIKYIYIFSVSVMSIFVYILFFYKFIFIFWSIWKNFNYLKYSILEI